MRKLLKGLYIFLSKLIMKRVYDKSYLVGRWFESNTKGWRWCWRSLFMQKIIGYNRKVPFPVSHRNNIGNYKNLYFSPNDMNNFQNFGCYFQNFEGKIYIGEGSYIAPNVGLITQNHVLKDLDKHEKSQDIILGKKCWIGMNAIILPGVTLGDNTIVGAGTVVTKSFINGDCVVVGNPGRLVKKL